MPPNAPSLLMLAQGTGSSLFATWTAPAVDAAHDAATGFALRYRPAGAGAWTLLQEVSSPCELHGLPQATAIDLQLRAANAAGASAWSTSSRFTTGATGPLAPGGPMPNAAPPKVHRRLPAAHIRHGHNEEFGSRCGTVAAARSLCRSAGRLGLRLRCVWRLLVWLRAHHRGSRGRTEA
jgi:hypothetical protein